MPSSSSARRRSERVRGRDALERALELAEARARRRRGRGSRAASTCRRRCRRYGRRDSRSSARVQSTARLHELKWIARPRARRCRARASSASASPAASSASNRSSTAVSGRSPARDQQIAALRGPARSAGLPVDDAAHEQAVALGQADRAAHPARVAGRRERHAQPWAPGRLARRERVDPRAHRLVGGDREDQAALAPHGVEPEQPALGVDQRAAARAAREAARSARSSRRRGGRRGRGTSGRWR